VGYAAVIDKGNGGIEVILEDDKKYASLTAAVASTADFNSYWFRPEWSQPTGVTRRLSPYQQFVQNMKPGLRDILRPNEHDFDAIIERINWYANTNVWVNRALSLRASLNAAEFNIFVPKNKEQSAWLKTLCKDLRMYSSVREMFWNLRAYDQACILWKTGKGDGTTPTRGMRPVSIECQDLRVVQPKGPGHTPHLVMYPHKDATISALAGLDRRTSKFRVATNVYPQVLLDAARKREAVPVEELEQFGYHFDYVARNRRDWDDTAFPSMYSIFADLELIALAEEIDANALHHYKAGILQFAIGPENPTNLETIPGPNVITQTEKEIKKQLQVRLSTLFSRGDVHIRWIVPPKDILSEEKYTSAVRRVFDYLGIPRVAWAGQSLEGAYAAAVSAMKFLRSESEDDRALMKEFLEGWLLGRARASNKFDGAEDVRVRFDPNALVEDRVTLELMRMFLNSGGASLATVLDMADLDIEYEAMKRKERAELEKEYKVDFGLEFKPKSGLISGAEQVPNRGGRPNLTADSIKAFLC
jgi:hypothetical protein